MSNEQTGKPPSQPKATFRAILKDSTADTQRVLDHTEVRPMNNRLQLIAALVFGVCVVFLATLLSAPRLDTALQVAVIAFVMALPLLVLDYMFASWKLKPGLRQLDEWLSEGIQWAAWLIGDGIGVLAVFVGIGAVVWHLSEAAFWLGVATLSVGFAGFVAVALVYAIRRAVREYDRQQQQQAQDG